MTEKRNITDYHYDAFISYRHLPKDMAVADKLQKLLEKHKIVIKGEHSTEKKKAADIPGSDRTSYQRRPGRGYPAGPGPVPLSYPHLFP